MTPQDDAARRAYWAEQFDAAYILVERTLTSHVDDCGEGFASLIDTADQAGVHVIFSDTQVVENIDRLFYLRQGMIDMYLAAAEAMNQRGWVMKVEDGFRTRHIQTGLSVKPDIFDQIVDRVAWECGGTPPIDLLFKRMACLIANYPAAGTHMSGSAIDISVFERRSGGAIGNEIDRGGPYVDMSERTPMNSPFVSEEAQRNRREITETMEAHGFVAYPYEFWHYNAHDIMGNLVSGSNTAPRYGPVDWDPQTNHVTPYENASQPLNPPDVIEREIAAALSRLNQ
ncbi:MAG: hypothetical protein CMJ49_00550 [Planctomycetaceae bacterium]|nr:hypothetical protein [Planctomycetaceae bacterium]